MNYLNICIYFTLSYSLFLFWAVQGIFEAGDQLLETERCLNQSREEIKRLTDFEKSASAKIRAVESDQKSAEASLLNLQNQVTELQRKLEWEYKSASQVRVRITSLKTL